MKKQQIYGKRLAGLLCAACFLAGCGRGDRLLLETTAQTYADAAEQAADAFADTDETDAGAAQSPFGADAQRQQTDGSTTQGQQAVFPEETGSESGQPGLCYIYVCGAVAQPGVYEVQSGARLCDVIACAGGMTADGEETSFNQAAVVYDGMMLSVPTKEQWASGEYVPGPDGMPVRIQAAGVSTQQETAAGDPKSDGLININEADAAQLCTLPGVGSARAESIIAYRQEHGVFRSIEEIKNVTGIKDALFEKIKTKIKV